MIIGIGESGDFFFPVARNRQLIVSIERANADAFDLVWKAFRQEELDEADVLPAGQTEIIQVEQAGITALKYSNATFIGLGAIGMRFAGVTTSTQTFEVIECNNGK